jgi:protein TIF31
LDSPETCFYTCYDLILHTKYGATHQLEDYSEISEIVDITCGGCSLEMVAGMSHASVSSLLLSCENLFYGAEINVLLGIYDERSIRSHLRRVRELLSLSSLHVSLSTSLALQQESAQEKSSGKVLCQFYFSRFVGLLINSV